MPSPRGTLGAETARRPLQSAKGRADSRTDGDGEDEDDEDEKKEEMRKKEAGKKNKKKGRSCAGAGAH